MSKQTANILRYTFLSICAVLVLFPLLFLAMSSLKTNDELFSSAFSLPQTPQFSNYVEIFTKFNQHIYFFNSLFYAVTVCIIGAIIDAAAAYAIGRMHWKLSKAALMLLLAGIMIPLHAILVPLYIVVSRFRMSNQMTLMLLFVASTIPTSVFLITGFLDNVPRAVEESAVIDGCSIPRMFVSVVCPIIMPALATVTIFNFMGVWNDLLLSLIFLTDERHKTLQLSIMRFKDAYFSNYGMLLTAIMISILPSIVVYLVMSDRIISGLTSGSVKG